MSQSIIDIPANYVATTIKPVGGELYCLVVGLRAALDLIQQKARSYGEQDVLHGENYFRGLSGVVYDSDEAAIEAYQRAATKDIFRFHCPNGSGEFAQAIATGTGNSDDDELEVFEVWIFA